MLVKQADNGNYVIEKFSQEEWISIGKQAGWIDEDGFLVECKSVKQRSRGTCVFQSTHPKVKDNKDHFPINDLAHGQNALARVNQYSSVPSWYSGTLDGLKKAVTHAVYKKFPGLKSRKEEREGT